MPTTARRGGSARLKGVSVRRAARDAPRTWRRSRHPAESVAECAGVGIAQSAGDLGDAHASAEKQLPCDLEAHFVQKLAERRALRFQAAVQRPRMHRQAARNGLLGEVAEEDARAKKPNDLVGDAGERDRPVL